MARQLRTMADLSSTDWSQLCTMVARLSGQLYMTVDPAVDYRRVLFMHCCVAGRRKRVPACAADRQLMRKGAPVTGFFRAHSMQMSSKYVAQGQQRAREHAGSMQGNLPLLCGKLRRMFVGLKGTQKSNQSRLRAVSIPKFGDHAERL